MKNHCIPYFGGKEITKTKYYMMKYYNKYVSMLFAVLLVSSAWAAEATTVSTSNGSTTARPQASRMFSVQCSMSNQEAGTTCKVAV